MSIRRWSAVALVAAVTWAASGCAAEEGAGNQEQIPIGVNIEKSGPAKVQGEAYERALKLVAAEVNKEGVQVGDSTKKVKLIIRDNKSDPAESVQVTKSLIDNDKVSAIIGGGSSPTTMSIVQTIEQREVPLISMGSSDAIVNPFRERRYTFKTPANTDVIADTMMSRFHKTGVKKVALLTVNNAYGDAGLRVWRQLDGDGDIDLVANEKFGDKDKDFTVQITKLVQSKPDAIVVWSIPPGSTIAAKNLRAANWPAKKVFLDAGAGAELFLKGAGKHAENMNMVHSPILAGKEMLDDTHSTPAQKSFYRDYTDKYGSFSGFAPMAADALTAIVKAIEEAGSADRGAIRDAMEKLQFEGGMGRYSFSPTYHGGVDGSSMTLLSVKDGDWKLSTE